jgi:hypothetical protein
VGGPGDGEAAGGTQTSLGAPSDTGANTAFAGEASGPRGGEGANPGFLPGAPPFVQAEGPSGAAVG